VGDRRPLTGASRLLESIEAYYDAVPRTDAAVEQVGPFTLFVKSGAGWPYYARPSLGTTSFTAADVHRVLSRQRELGIPESFEWVAETTLSLAAAVEDAGLVLTRHPLMVLDDDGRLASCRSDEVEIRMATVSDDLALLNAIARVAFGAPGTAAGPAGLEAARDLVEREPDALARQQERLRTGRTVMAAAFAAGEPVGIGSHQPVGPVTEIVGVGVLPAFRRHGIAAALTGSLSQDARRRGVTTVFLSAGDETIARVYARVGFRSIATACAAEPPSNDDVYASSQT